MPKMRRSKLNMATEAPKNNISNEKAHGVELRITADEDLKVPVSFVNGINDLASNIIRNLLTHVGPTSTILKKDGLDLSFVKHDTGALRSRDQIIGSTIHSGEISVTDARIDRFNTDPTGLSFEIMSSIYMQTHPNWKLILGKDYLLPRPEISFDSENELPELKLTSPDLIACNSAILVSYITLSLTYAESDLSAVFADRVNNMLTKQPITLASAYALNSIAKITTKAGRLINNHITPEKLERYQFYFSNFFTMDPKQITVALNLMSTHTNGLSRAGVTQVMKAIKGGEA